MKTTIDFATSPFGQNHGKMSVKLPTLNVINHHTKPDSIKKLGNNTNKTKTTKRNNKTSVDGEILTQKV